MGNAATSPILRVIRRLVEDPRVKDLPDQELLRRFCAEQDERAFQTLLRRHGSMVLDVCRCVLGNEADADDAFQATFLVFVRKAKSIREVTSLGSWLYGVAYRTALKARAEFAKRKRHEARVLERAATESPDDCTWREVQQVLHGELNALSERYQVPLMLCYLQGKTQDEAAAQLGVPKGTLKGRLERGRALLRERLQRRGLGPAAVLIASAWPAATVSASVPASLATFTVKAATQFAAGGAAASVVSAKVAVLTEGVLKTMFLSKLKIAGLVFLVLTLAGGALGMRVVPALEARPTAGAGLKIFPAREGTSNVQRKPAKADKDKFQGTWAIVRTVENGKEQKGIIGGVEIVGDKLLMTSALGESQYTFTLDATKTPKWIDITFTEGKGFFNAKKGEKSQWIYRLQGDTLTLCTGPTDKERPTEFAAKVGSGHTLAVLQRLRAPKQTEEEHE